MKNVVSYKLLKCAALVLALGGGTLVHAESATNTASPIASPALIKSVFIAATGSGKDPFYPNSNRRLEVTPQPQSIATNSVPKASTIQIALKGISSSRGQRFALLNSTTIGVGELAEIRCGTQWVKIRCREIRDRSVLIELDGTGELKELKLRDGV